MNYDDLGRVILGVLEQPKLKWAKAIRSGDRYYLVIEYDDGKGPNGMMWFNREEDAERAVECTKRGEKCDVRWLLEKSNLL